MIHHGDCLEVMAGMEAGSVDAVVTDPPYGLEFMGKAWDRPWAVGFSQMGIEGHRNATPSFSSNRNAVCQTCHKHQRGSDKCRCEVPDFDETPRTSSVAFGEWSQGWARAAFRVARPGAYLLAFGGTRTYHRMTVAIEDAGWIIRDCLVWAYACVDEDTEILTSEGWVRYHSASEGQLAAAFDPDSGELRWQAIEAVHTYAHTGLMAEVGPSLVTLNHRVVLDASTARVPRLPRLRDDVHAALGMGEESRQAGLLEGVQREAAHPRSAVPAGQAFGVDRRITGILPCLDEWTAQSGLEGRRYRVQEARELLGSPVRALAGVGAGDGAAGWLRDGAPADRGGDVWLPAHADGMREPRGPRSDEQRPGEPDALAGQPDAQALRMGQVPGGDGEPDAVRLVGYDGIVWCITVPTGAFVARRDGVIFVTGNSGFPKSRALLKPAWEPIVMARKPGPLRELAIDACRIPGAVPTTTQGGRHSRSGLMDATGPERHDVFEPADGGRWPANLILTDDLFSGDTPGVVGGGWQKSNAGTMAADGVIGGYGGTSARKAGTVLNKPDLEGTYSRFFLIPKADRAEREPTITPDGHDRTRRFTTHPTVKPLDLMRHLVRLVTPTGGLVLDPFLGSGTTALAAELEGFQWIGIEREAEYVAIAEARLNGTQRGLGLPA